MRKKRIAVLHAQRPFVCDRAEMLTKNLTKELRSRGYEAERVSLPFKEYPVETLYDCFLNWRMLDLSESCGEKIDLVIATQAPTYCIQHANKALWLIRQHRAAYDLRDDAAARGLNTIAGGQEAAQMIAKWDNRCISQIPNVYTISQSVSNRLMQYNRIASKPLYHPPGLMGRYHFGEHGDYIFAMGSSDVDMRNDLAIQALPFCNKSICLKIAEAGHEAEKLQKLARDLGVEKRVDFLDSVSDSDRIELYAQALGVCDLSYNEDYSYVTLEAFLSGKPVVTGRDTQSMQEFAKDGENACVAEPIPEEIGRSFNALLANKANAQRMGKAGFERVKNISWDAVIDRLTQTL